MIIYHNPRCSKSRQTLAIIVAAGTTPSIVSYLNGGLSEAEVKDLLSKLGVTARAVIRKGEDAYKTLGLDKLHFSEEELIAAIVKHPKLLERPIVVKGSSAIIGRPPENVLALF